MSDVKDLRNGNCSDMNYRFTAPQGEKAHFSEDTKKELLPAVSEQEKMLVSQGGKKIYEDYQKTACAAQIRFLPGHSYTAIGAVFAEPGKDLYAMISAINGDDIITGIRKEATENSTFLAVSDLRSDISIPKGIYLIDGEGKPISASCLQVFERIFDFKKEFYSLLEGRNNGFKDFKIMAGNQDTDNNQLYYSSAALGYDQAKIFETTRDYNFVIVLDFKKPKTLTFLDDLEAVMAELPAQGFTAENYKNGAGGNVVEYKKNGEIVMMLASYPDKDTAYFYIYKIK